jgi:hypothetical protein
VVIWFFKEIEKTTVIYWNRVFDFFDNRTYIPELGISFLRTVSINPKIHPDAWSGLDIQIENLRL